MATVNEAPLQDDKEKDLSGCGRVEISIELRLNVLKTKAPNILLRNSDTYESRWQKRDKTCQNLSENCQFTTAHL